MRKLKNKEMLLQYLNEHLRYEREMLGSTFSDLNRQPQGHQWNAFYELFGIHARNLYNFFRHKKGNGQNTILANDYVVDRSKSKDHKAFGELNTFIFHLSENRTKEEKITLGRLYDVGDWIDNEWAVWIAALPEPYQGKLSADPVCVRSLEAVATIDSSCTTTTSLTLSVGFDAAGPLTYKSEKRTRSN